MKQSQYKPRHITIQLTQNCNLNCPYCFAKDYKKSNTEFISKEDFEYLLNFCLLNNVRNIAFTGGEPFLHKESQNFINKVLNLGMNANVYSNLTIEKCLDDLDIKKKPLCILVNINDFGSYKENELNNLHYNLQTALKKGIHIYFSHNVFELPINIDYAVKLALMYDVKGIRVSQSNPIIDSGNKWLHFKEIKEFGFQLINISKSLRKHGIKVNLDCPIPYCLLPEEYVDYLEKNVSLHGFCPTRIGVHTDLTVGHCYVTRSLIEKKKITEFESYNQLERFIEDQVEKFNSEGNRFIKCYKCIYFKNKVCNSGCFGLRWKILGRENVT